MTTNRLEKQDGLGTRLAMNNVVLTKMAYSTKY